MQRVRPHALRHAVATMLVNARTNVRVVSDLLGHAAVAFTLQTYFRPSEKDAAAAVAQIEEALRR